MDYVFLEGLVGLKDSAINHWIGPILIIVIAGMAVKLAYGRQIREAALFAVVAVIAALFVFFGEDIFGKDGSITTLVKDTAVDLNLIKARWF